MKSVVECITLSFCVLMISEISELLKENISNQHKKLMNFYFTVFEKNIFHSLTLQSTIVDKCFGLQVTINDSESFVSPENSRTRCFFQE